MSFSNDNTDPIALLQSAREIFQRNHSHLSQEELGRQWSLVCNSGFDVSRHDTPRSLSMPMSSWSPTPPTNMNDISYAHEMNRQHGHSAPMILSRDQSNNAFSIYQNSASNSRQSIDQFHTYEPTPLPNGRKRKHRPAMPKFIETTDFDPPEYVTKLNHDNAISPTSFSPSYEHYPQGLPVQDSSRLSVTEYSYTSPTDSSLTSSPMSGALTNTSTFSSVDMSRNPSVQSTGSFVQSFDMMRMQSTEVPLPSMSASHSDISFTQNQITPHDVSRSRSDSDVLPSSHRSSRLSTNFKSVSSLHQLAPSMQRSDSSQSVSSDSSSQSHSRLSRRHHEQLAQQRPIAPKESASVKLETQKMTRVQSEDGSWKDYGVIPRKEKTYQRPQHPKLFCNYCSDHPEGFRGEHELQRHTNRAHASTRKVWICVDSSPDSKFLSNCKACRTSKRYGAYYNAAAHLRRAHFNPRKRGRKAKTEAEKRGGKGGGNWPAMEILKEKWMREIDEVVNDDNQPLTDDDEPDNITDTTPVSHEAFNYDPSSAAVDTLPEFAYTNSFGAVNFDTTFVDTSFTSSFELSCADTLMSQATGLNSGFYQQLAFDDNVYMPDQHYQQQQATAYY